MAQREVQRCLKVLVVHGPNLNLLGVREPGVYGRSTLAAIDAALAERGRQMGAEVVSFQSNHEGGIIDRLHAARGECDAVIINPGAYTHYSYAIRDAITAIGLPTVEVHLSNVQAREEFRHVSVISPVCVGAVVGLGPIGYELALEALIRLGAAREGKP